jgi:hypothetical protein
MNINTCLHIVTGDIKHQMQYELLIVIQENTVKVKA